MNAIKIPQILLPKDVDMELWAVNACDQFTSDKKYWSQLDALVGDKPSTLRLIFPEIYLKDKPKARIEEINAHMRDYIYGGIFAELQGGLI